MCVCFAGVTCVTSCEGLADGEYASCSGCNMYVECASDVLTNHVCPSGLFWNVTGCVNSTVTTCSQSKPLKKLLTFKTNFFHE